MDFFSTEFMGEMFGQFGGAMAAGVLLIYAVLVLLFRNFLQPITILVALPLSIGGAFGALLLTGRPIDMPAFIGLLMLMGIVTKNSILLVEYAIEREAAGLTRQDALLEAGTTRARPIVMTTVAMVAGMLLPAFGIGAGAGFRSSMAIVVIGGLVASTVLSLVFVPVVYAVMAGFGDALARRLRRLTTVSTEDLTGSRAVLTRNQETRR
ncbi:efflux RND transporter permease subunit [Leptolyngbya sp. 15MV]|nr:efflux RND transporter permease subunit [Leptolyngbya sp. 15MV]